MILTFIVPTKGASKNGCLSLHYIIYKRSLIWVNIFVEAASRTFQKRKKHATFVVIGALRVKSSLDADQASPNTLVVSFMVFSEDCF